MSNGTVLPDSEASVEKLQGASSDTDTWNTGRPMHRNGAEEYLESCAASTSRSLARKLYRLRKCMHKGRHLAKLTTGAAKAADEAPIRNASAAAAEAIMAAENMFSYSEMMKALEEVEDSACDGVQPLERVREVLAAVDNRQPGTPTSGYCSATF